MNVFEVFFKVDYHCGFGAGVAQLVEQLICNQPVGGSTPFASSNFLPFRSISLQSLFAAQASGISLSDFPC